MAKSSSKEKSWFKKILFKNPFFISDKKVDIDVDSQNQFGNTKLMYAVANNNATEYKALIEENNADVDVQNPEGQSALIISAANGNFEATEYLVSKNADLNLQDSDGRTALMAACVNGNIKIVRYLAKKANLALLDSEKNNVLQIAIKYGHPEIANFLVEKGVDVNNENKHGDIALHMCVKKKEYAKLAKLIIKGTNNIDKENKLGITPIKLGIEFDNPEIARELKERGAQANPPMPNKYKIFFAISLVSTIAILADEGSIFRGVIHDAHKLGYTTREALEKTGKHAIFFFKKLGYAASGWLVSWIYDCLEGRIPKPILSLVKENKSKIAPIKLKGANFDSNEISEDVDRDDQDDRESSGKDDYYSEL
jgi:ankyrin repeat protein